jgi:hypothetical protein
MDVPGRADQVSDSLKKLWGSYVAKTYDGLKKTYPSRFFHAPGTQLTAPKSLRSRWFADPLEPRTCMGEEVARQLCDWPIEGRFGLHDEYCEYHVTYATDASGKARPKRVAVSTEMREFWTLVAQHDPKTVQRMAKDVLGFEPSMRDLYGIDDPVSASPARRRRMFIRQTAGNGNFEAGPNRPQGPLNTQNLLFMSVGVNGLDDLLFIHMFGSLIYSVDDAAGRRPATRDEIFLQRSRPDLSCRNSDPEAALTVQSRVQQGHPVAFADPIGIYIHSFTQDKFIYKDEVIPERWVRWRRGQKGMFQRLEVGPGDDEPVFLDEILVLEGAEETPLTGGYQIVTNVEVGPLMVYGKSEPILPEDHVLLQSDARRIDCAEAGVCATIRALKDRYDAEHRPPSGLRGGSRNPDG